MKRRERVLKSTLGLFCAVAQLLSAPARAEDASAAETAAARSLAVEGLKLAQAGDCAGALPKLERAEKLYHAVVVASRLGECYASVGRLVEGTEVLRKLLREPQPAEVTPAISKALERAQRVLDAAKPRIASLTIKAAAVQDMSVKLDGVLVPSALVDTEIPTDPGEHSVEVSAPGFLKSGTRIKLIDAEKKSVTLTLTRDPNAAVATAATPVSVAHEAGPNSPPSRPLAAPATEQSVPPPPPANHTAAYVSFGFGAAGVLTGSVLGVLTLKQRQALQGDCPNNVCPADKQADLASAKKLGNVSTVAFGIGGAGLVLGTVLLFTVGSSTTTDHAVATSSSRFAGISAARVGVGPGQLVLDGNF